MKTRMVSMLAAGAVALGVLAIGMGHFNLAEAGKEAQTGPAEMELLFVQNAGSGSFEGTTLSLHGVGPTIYFSDRPYRVDGHVRTAKLVAEWDKGPDSFAEDPPNAVLSILDKAGVNSAVVVLSEPKLEGGTLTYTVKVSSGTIPATFKDASLFIDMFGRGAAFLGGMALSHAVTRANQPSTVYVQQPHTYYRAAAPAPCVCQCN